MSMAYVILSRKNIKVILEDVLILWAIRRSYNGLILSSVCRQREVRDGVDKSLESAENRRIR